MRRILMQRSSHPASAKFGKHYTAEEVNDIFAPSEESVNAVKGWLEAAGIAAHRVSQSANKQWMQFDAHVHEAEELLKTKYHVYKHKTLGKTNVGCDE